MWWSTVGGIVTLTYSILALTLVVEAQPAKVPRIGVLALTTMQERDQVLFREGPRERGYAEGHNIRVEYRWLAAGQAERLNDLAAELVHLPVDLLVAVSTPAAHAAQRAT